MPHAKLGRDIVRRYAPMNPPQLDTLAHFLQTYALPFAWRIVGALVLWVVGGWVIRIFARLANNAMALRHVDKTLAAYANAAIRVGLRVLLIIAILGVFGIETTSLAALLAAAGIAIGTAWSGLLSNLAAGVFLVVLRPFKVGDVIQAAGVTGEVKSIGLFMTALNTGENLRTFVGNSKVLAETIVNYTTNGYRRVDLRAQLAFGVDPRDAMTRLTARVAKIPNVLADPAPQIAINEFSASGPVLAVRPFCATEHYQQVWFDTNAAIADVLAEAGYPVPATYQVTRGT
jgi:small conductance mechanosensitive channel